MTEIEALDHLSYIIEAIAENLPGEAKLETASLERRVEKAVDLPPEVRDRLLMGLSSAQEEFREHRYSVREGAVSLCSASRYVWERVLRSRETAGLRSAPRNL